MEFTAFLEIVPKIINEPLPGFAAHAKMAPLSRLPSLEPDYYNQYNPRPSAVMMLFYPKNDRTHLVLMKRNTYPGIHSAQISFPGGKKETYDASLEQTALRETEEELGIEVSGIQIVKPFSQVYIPPSNFLVAPFMGISNVTPLFEPDPAEVASVIHLPLDHLVDDSIIINTEMQTSYAQQMTVPAFKVDDHIVWGATAMMLSELKETIKNALK